MKQVGKFLIISVFSACVVLLFWSTISTARLLPELKTLPDIHSLNSGAGFEFKGSSIFNRGSITSIDYTGECPGFSEGTISAQFSSPHTPTAPGRRVVIKNVTKGVSTDSYPYTDREYDKGRVSQGTRMAFGTHHSPNYFKVLVGTNTFEYEIEESDKVIETGSFQAVINKFFESKDRNKISSFEQVCRYNKANRNNKHNKDNDIPKLPDDIFDIDELDIPKLECYHEIVWKCRFF